VRLQRTDKIPAALVRRNPDRVDRVAAVPLSRLPDATLVAAPTGVAATAMTL